MERIASNLVGCVFYPWLAVQLQRGERAGPFVVLSARRPRVVIDCDPAGTSICRGMLGDQVAARHPSAVAQLLDTALLNEFGGRVASGLASLAGVVEIAADEMGVFYFDAGPGLDAGAVIADLTLSVLDAIPSDMDVRLGFGPGKFYSRCASGLAPPGGSHLASSVSLDWLLGLPSSTLPVSGAALQRMSGAGVVSIGEVAALSFDQLAHLVGSEAGLIWGICRGSDDRPVQDSGFRPQRWERLEFPFPADTRDALAHGVGVLSQRIWKSMPPGRMAAEGVALEGECDDGASWSYSREFRRSPTDGDDMARMIMSSMGSQGWDGSSCWPSSPLVELSMWVTGWKGWSGDQLPLERVAPGGSRSVESLAGAGRLVAMETWSNLPERRWANPDGITPHDLPRAVDVRSSSGVPRAVLQGGVWRDVESVVDAWELESDWWAAEPIHRRYWRIVCSGGKQMLVFRDLLGGFWYRQRG